MHFPASVKRLFSSMKSRDPSARAMAREVRHYHMTVAATGLRSCGMIIFGHLQHGSHSTTFRMIYRVVEIRADSANLYK